MHKKVFYQKLIQRFVNNTATEEELELLFKLIEDEEFTAALSSFMDEDLKSRLLQAKEEKTHPIRKMPIKWIAIAASLLLIASVSIYIFNAGKATKQITKIDAEKNVIKPGSNQAILTLNNGEQVVLNNSKTGLISKQPGVQILKSNNGTIVYKISNTSHSNTQNEFNTITTPKGGQYQIVLEDGSKIWLNAQSSIKLPTTFGLKERRIEITGEVYCEISKDSKRPFKVAYGNQVVEVLGTHFNINAYADESTTKTTLLEGSIKLTNIQTSQGKLLVPNEQGVLIKKGNILAIKRVETESVIAWKNGYFMFDQEPLESIMRKVSRWYDVEIVYNNNPPQKKFGGRLSKFDDINKLLDVLEATGSVKFETQGRRITVMN
jgi:transmembrane sensor